MQSFLRINFKFYRCFVDLHLEISNVREKQVISTHILTRKDSIQMIFDFSRRSPPEHATLVRVRRAGCGHWFITTSTLAVVILPSVLLISVTKPPAGSYARYVRPIVPFPVKPVSEE